MNTKNILKSSVAVAALFAVVAPAHAGSVSNGNDTASVTLSGQFNKAIAYAENGQNSALTIADNDISGSRFRIVVSGKLNEAVSVGGVMEMAYTQNELSSLTFVPASNTGDDSTETASGTDTFGVRHNYIKLTHKGMGAFSIGHTSVATDGAMFAPFNPASSVVDAATASFAGVNTRVSTAAANTNSGQVGDFFASYDGGRTDVVKYNTPNFAGFSGVVSYDSSQNTDVAGSFGGKFASFQVKLGAAYRNVAGAKLDGVLAVTGGVKHDSGISLAGGYAKEDKGTQAFGGKTYHVILGYEADLISAGKTGIAVQYMKAQNTTADDDEGISYEIGVQQDMGAGITTYGGVKVYEVDTVATTSFDDVVGVMAGVKLAF